MGVSKLIKISIIVPTLNEERTIAETIVQFSGLKIPHEVIVSDCESGDGTVKIAEKYTNNVVMTKKPHNAARARNKGAENAHGDYLAFVDSGVRIPNPDDFFERMLQFFEKDAKLVGAVTAINIEPSQATRADKIFPAIMNATIFVFNNILKIGNGIGKFQMIRAETFRKIGGYREDLPAGEDNDIFRRLSRVGKTRYCIGFPVFHSGRRAHKLGWLKLLYISIKSSLSVYLLNKSAFKEWEPLR